VAQLNDTFSAFMLQHPSLLAVVKKPPFCFKEFCFTVFVQMPTSLYSGIHGFDHEFLALLYIKLAQNSFFFFSFLSNSFPISSHTKFNTCACVCLRYMPADVYTLQSYVCFHTPRMPVKCRSRIVCLSFWFTK